LDLNRRQILERRRVVEHQPHPITVFPRAWDLQDQVRFAGSRRYLTKRIVREVREVCNRLRAKGYLKDPKRPLKRRGLGDHNKAEVRRRVRLITESTGVVVGLRASQQLLSCGIANQRYLQRGQSNSGAGYDYDVVWMGQEPNEHRPGEMNQVCTIFEVGEFELRYAKAAELINVPISR